MEGRPWPQGRPPLCGPWPPPAKLLLPSPPPARTPHLALCPQCQRTQKIKFISLLQRGRPSAQPGRSMRGVPARDVKAGSAGAPLLSTTADLEPQDTGFPSLEPVKGDKLIGILSSEGVVSFLPSSRMNGKPVVYQPSAVLALAPTSPISP